jgi:ADP-ribosylation factor GTPase-activating protein 1
MDAFKAAEIERMRNGGNQAWKEFFDGAEENKAAGVTWDDATISERYGGSVGDEYKERLTAKVEGREYVKSAVPSKAKAAVVGGASQGGSAAGSRSQTPLGTNRTASPGMAESGKVKVDDRYFSKLGAENASRSADLPPSQGGKYAGFGSSGPEPVRQEPALPGLDDLQKDPVAALTRGFGWFTTTVTKTAKTVNDSYIQPTARQVCFLVSSSCCI